MLIHLNSEIKIDKSQTKKVQKIKISHNYCAFTFANILLVAFTFSINLKFLNSRAHYYLLIILLFFIFYLI
jgi:hypothetical protein